MPSTRHREITALPGRQPQAAAAAGLLPPVNAHRRLRGPYTAAGTVMRALVPGALSQVPGLVAAHDIEILSAAPELRGLITPRRDVLPSLDTLDRSTRFLPGSRTIRLANGLAEFIGGYLAAVSHPPASLTFWCADQADPTDAEFLSVLARRTDPARLTLVTAAAGPPDEDAGPGDPVRLAAAYVTGDCLSTTPDLLAAYDSLPGEARQELHDRRAAELERAGEYSLRLGAIPYHRERGSAPGQAGAQAVSHALSYCLNMGFYAAAIDFGQRGRDLTSWTADPDARYLLTTRLATAMISAGRPAGADALYQEIRENTTDPGAHMGTAYASAILCTRHYPEELRDHQRARGWINQAIAMAAVLPGSERLELQRVFNNVGLALIENHLGNRAAALELVSAGIAMLPADAGPGQYRLQRSVLHLRRTQVYAALGRMDDAVAEYRRVLAADPDYAEYHFDLAGMLRELGRDDEALAEYEAALALSPPFAEAHYNRADIRAARGDLDGARADLEYVLELDPGCTDAYVNLAGVLMQLGDTPATARAVTAGLAAAPGTAHLLCLRGQLELAAGRPDAARAALDDAISSDAGLAEAWATRGALAFDQGDLSGALADLSRAWELSQDAAVLYNRALVHEAMGSPGAAVADLDRVLAQDPSDADSWLAMARCRARAADLDAGDQTV